MKAWNSFPMLRLVLPFMAGIILFSFLLEGAQVDLSLILLGLFLAGFLTLFLVIAHATLGRRPHLFGLVLGPLLFLLGGLLTISVCNYVFPGRLDENRLTDSHQVFLARVSEEPQVRQNSVKVVAELEDKAETMHGKALLYFQVDSTSPIPKYGEELLIHTQLQPILEVGNPNEFNYPRYLRFHNILFRGYVKSENWKSLSSGKPSFIGWFANFRSQLIAKFKEAGLDGDELAVASALVLGHRTELDQELMTAYAGAGATHVLAVSGLHVGIVYLILNSLLKFLERYRYGRLIKTILLIALLLSYAVLTGLSASVSRAAVMFVFVAIGKAINRDSNIFNTLATSAFFLLVYNPMMIMQVGFQLSYLAVIGIVVIHPILFNLIIIENRFLDWVWSISCVSIAAQIVTFPLGLLYFHQFPNLFLLSNLVVIPAATGILYLGFGLFLFGLFTPLLPIFGFVLKWVILILNQVVIWIEQIPYSVLSGIDITTAEALMIYVIIVGILVFISGEQRYGLYLSLVIGIVLMILQTVEVQEQKNQRFSTIYNVKGHTAIALVNGSEVTFIARKELYENEQSMLFHVRHHWWRKGISSEKFIELNDSLINRRLDWGDESFSIINLAGKLSDVESIKDEYINHFIVDALDWDNCQIVAECNGELIVSNQFGYKTAEKIRQAGAKHVKFVSEIGAVTN
ncbi:MAG: ComEC family competence protein [Flavobacteriales bacterium]|nr:ComEC family competence protein [Flavobacteriales bacterium]